MFRTRNVKRDGPKGMVRDAPPTPIARRFAPALAAGSCLLAASAASPAAAQPPAAPTREQVEQVRPPPEEGQRTRLTIEGGVEHAPCALDRPDYENIRFTLTEAVFDDLKGLPAEALRPAFAPYLGQENNIAVVCAIRDRAATILRDAGYLAAVEVPEQRIEGGRVHFTVLMARLVGLQVRGDAGRSERTIARYLSKLTEREVFNRFDAERYLLLAGDLPGYDVRLALRSAGRARGEVIGEVIVTRQGPIVEATVQNLGSHALGRWGALARAQFYGLTGLGDRTTLAFFTTLDMREQQTAQIGHDFRIGGEGLALGAQLTYSWASPDLGDPLVHINSHTLFATVEASYPLVRRQARTLRAAGGIDLIDQDIRFNGLPLNRDRLRVVFARTLRRRARPRRRQSALHAGGAGLAARRIGRGAPGPRSVRREHPVRADARRLPAARRSAADPAGGRSDRLCAARQPLRRSSADAAAHLRTGGARPI